MELADPRYATLIRSLPVKDHAVRVARSVWEPRFAAAGLTTEFEAIFGDELEVSLSREQIRRQADRRRKCLEVLLWGYPAGMRGNETAYLANLDAISERAASDAQWPDYFASLDDLKGLGMSTITKLAYFFGKTFEGHPAVILDSRIVAVLTRATWEEFAGLRRVTYNNASKHYLRYLETTASVTESIPGSTPEQLEFFLFSLGNAFGPSASGGEESPTR